VLNQLKTEFFKLRKRWLPYVLMVVMLASVLLPIVINYINYNDILSKHPELNDVEVIINPDGSTEITGLPHPEPGSSFDFESSFLARQLARYKQSLVLPGAMENVFNSVPGFGMFLVIVFAASVIGNEYAWGTVRQSIARGTSRLSYFVAKLLTSAIGAAAGILIAVLAGFIATIITSLLVEGAILWEGFAAWFFTSLGCSFLVIAVYLAMANFFAVALRSAMAGMAVAVAWFIGESIVLALVSMSTGWLADTSVYFISYNTSQLLSIGGAEGFDGFLWKPVLILAGYIVVFIAGAYGVFRRQDLNA